MFLNCKLQLLLLWWWNSILFLKVNFLFNMYEWSVPLHSQCYSLSSHLTVSVIIVCILLLVPLHLYSQPASNCLQNHLNHCASGIIPLGTSVFICFCSQSQTIILCISLYSTLHN